MRISKYLVVRKSQYSKSSARITDKKPSLHPDEVAIYMSIEIPDSLFQRPALNAVIKIDEKAAPSQISAEVIDNIQQVLSENLKLNVEVTQINQ